MAVSYRYLMRFEDGPYAGRTTISTVKPPGRVLVMESELIAPGVLGWLEPDCPHARGDETEYERVTDSELPDDFEHPNVLPGGRFLVAT